MKSRVKLEVEKALYEPKMQTFTFFMNRTPPKAGSSMMEQFRETKDARLPAMAKLNIFELMTECKSMLLEEKSLTEAAVEMKKIYSEHCAKVKDYEKNNPGKVDNEKNLKLQASNAERSAVSNLKIIRTEIVHYLSLMNNSYDLTKAALNKLYKLLGSQSKHEQDFHTLVGVLITAGLEITAQFKVYLADERKVPKCAAEVQIIIDNADQLAEMANTFKKECAELATYLDIEGHDNVIANKIKNDYFYEDKIDWKGEFEQYCQNKIDNNSTFDNAELSALLDENMNQLFFKAIQHNMLLRQEIPDYYKYLKNEQGEYLLGAFISNLAATDPNVPRVTIANQDQQIEDLGVAQLGTGVLQQAPMVVNNNIPQATNIAPIGTISAATEMTQYEKNLILGYNATPLNRTLRTDQLDAAKKGGENRDEEQVNISSVRVTLTGKFNKFLQEELERLDNFRDDVAYKGFDPVYIREIIHKTLVQKMEYSENDVTSAIFRILAVVDVASYTLAKTRHALAKYPNLLACLDALDVQDRKTKDNGDKVITLPRIIAAYPDVMFRMKRSCRPKKDDIRNIPPAIQFTSFASLLDESRPDLISMHLMWSAVHNDRLNTSRKVLVSDEEWFRYWKMAYESNLVPTHIRKKILEALQVQEIVDPSTVTPPTAFLTTQPIQLCKELFQTRDVVNFVNRLKSGK